MNKQNVTYKNSDDQSSNEHYFIPNKDGIFLEPLNKFTNANRIKREKLIAYFFH